MVNFSCNHRAMRFAIHPRDLTKQFFNCHLRLELLLNVFSCSPDAGSLAFLTAVQNNLIFGQQCFLLVALLNSLL